MCGIMAEYDTIQNKIKNGYIFKASFVTIYSYNLMPDSYFCFYSNNAETKTAFYMHVWFAVKLNKKQLKDLSGLLLDQDILKWSHYVLWDCSQHSWTFLRDENWLEIEEKSFLMVKQPKKKIQQQYKTPVVRKFYLNWGSWVHQLENDPKHTSKSKECMRRKH